MREEEEEKFSNQKSQHFSILPSPSRLVHVLLDLRGEPLHPLVQPLPSGRVGRADVPRLVHDLLQAEHLRHLHAGHGVAAVQLVGEEQDGNPARADVLKKKKRNLNHRTGMIKVPNQSR